MVVNKIKRKRFIDFIDPLVIDISSSLILMTLVCYG